MKNGEKSLNMNYKSPLSRTFQILSWAHFILLRTQHFRFDKIFNKLQPQLLDVLFEFSAIFRL